MSSWHIYGYEFVTHMDMSSWHICGYEFVTHMLIWIRDTYVDMSSWHICGYEFVTHMWIWVRDTYMESVCLLTDISIYIMMYLFKSTHALWDIYVNQHIYSVCTYTVVIYLMKCPYIHCDISTYITDIFICVNTYTVYVRIRVDISNKMSMHTLWYIYIYHRYIYMCQHIYSTCTYPCWYI